MDINLFRGLVAVAVMVLFILIWVSAWSKTRKADFEKAARIPLEDSQLEEVKGDRNV